MANKYLLRLKRYLMRKVSVCTSKSSRLGSVYKLTMLTAQRSQGSNLRFQPILWSMTITRYYTIMQNRNNYCSLDLTSLFHHTLGFMLLAYTGKCPQADPAKRTTDKTSSAVTNQFVLKLWLLRRDLSKLRPVYMYDFRLCDSWKIRFQTRQFGHQWSCQNTCWVQLGHVSSALSALRPWAAKMAPILWSILSRQVQDNSDWSENLTGLMTFFIITTWRGITCRIAVTIEGVGNAYLPGNVHFQYRP